MKTRGTLYCLDRVVDPAYAAELRRLEALDVCMFCDEGIAQGLVEVQQQGEHWYIVKNKYPYAGTLAHWMAVGKAHWLDLDALEDGVGDELFALFGTFMKTHGLSGAGCVMRFGDMKRTCASVAHTHVHFIATENGRFGTDEEFVMHLGYRAK